MRPAQHLDVRDIPELHRAADRAAHIDIVDIDADAGIDRGGSVGLPDAADEDLGGRIVARQRTIGRELQVGRDLVEIGRADDLLALQRPGGEHRDRHRRVLQALLATARRHHDFLVAGLAGPLCGHARRKQCGARKDTGRIKQ